MLPALFRLLTSLAKPDRLARSPSVRAFAISALIWVTAFFACRLIFWRNPHSAFFQSETIYELGYSRTRADQALELVRQANGTLLKATERKGARRDPIICAAIVTVKREPVQYLAEMVGSLLEGLHPDERASLYLYIHFANTDPALHPDWNSTWARNLADATESYHISNEEMERIKGVERERNFAVKGVFDYVYTLKRCMETGAPYIAAFEDDIILADGWMTRTLNGLKHIVSQEPSLLKPWVYLRLFYTETALMWEPTDFWYAHMPLAFGLAMLVGLILLRTVRRRWSASHVHLDNLTVAVLCLITIPGFVALLFMVGKYTLQPMRSVQLMNGHGCCSQALVFPKSQIPDLIKALEYRGAGQTDSMIEEYSDENGLDRYTLSPQAAQHIGLHSSRNTDIIDAQSVWGFYFETNDPLKLKKEHDLSMSQGIDQWDILRDTGWKMALGE